MNEHEIEFAEVVSERAIEVNESMNKYISLILRVSYRYAQAIKVMSQGNFIFQVADWKAKSRTSAWDEGFPTFTLKYKKITLLKTEWFVNKEGTIRFRLARTFINTDNLFYITEFINTIDKTITEMSIMMSKVNI